MILPLIIIKINLFFFKVKIFFMYLLLIRCNTPLLILKFKYYKIYKIYNYSSSLPTTLINISFKSFGFKNIFVFLFL